MWSKVNLFLAGWLLMQALWTASIGNMGGAVILGILGAINLFAGLRFS